MDVSGSEGTSSKKRSRHTACPKMQQRRRCRDSDGEQQETKRKQTDAFEEQPNDSIDVAVSKSRRKVYGYDLRIPSIVGRAGQLLRVKLINFMCHEHFEIYFGNHVNFVSGKNGSGKSAILQAIQLCFGSKAFDTGRGRNARGFIKTGRQYAKITVTVWNTGPEAYRKSEFGRVITVERSLTSNSNRYALIGETGRCVSNKRQDLEDLITKFAILCKNPMVVLTQGAASSFLRGKKLAADLYKLYMKATEFEDAAEEHAESHKYIQGQKLHLNEAKEQLKEMKAHETDLHERLELAREEKTASECVVHAENALGYIKANEKQETLQLVEGSLNEEMMAMESLENAVNEKRRTRDAAITEREEFNEEGKAGKIRDVLKRMKTEEHALKDRKREAERDCRVPRKNIETFKAEIEQRIKDKEQKLETLEALRNDDGEEARAAKEAFDEEVRQMEQQIDQTTVEYSQLAASYTEITAEIKQRQAEASKMADACTEQSGKVRSLQANLNQLQTSQRDPVTVFGGDSMRALLSGIQKCQNSFERQPIGPIGRYLSVVDEAWSLPIEFTIGGLFNSFIVHSFQDEKTLRSICQKLRLRLNLQVIVFPFNRPAYRTGIYENPPRPTILKMLQIVEFEASHVIRCVLIDYANIERIVLWTSEEEAFQIIRESRNSAFRPLSVRLPSGRRVYQRNGSQVSVHDGRNLQPRLVKDHNHQIEQTKKKIDDANALLQQRQKEKEDFVRRSNEIDRRLESVESSLQNLENTKQRQTQELHWLKERGPALPAHATLDIDDIQNEINAIDNFIEETREKIAEEEKQLEYKESQVRAIEDKISAHRVEITKTKADADQLGSRFNDLMNTCEAAKAEFDRAQEALTTKQRHVDRLKADIQRVQLEIEECRREATERCVEEDYQIAVDILTRYLTETGDVSQLSSDKLEGLIVEFNRRIRNFRQHSSDRFDDLEAEHEEVKTAVTDMAVGISSFELLLAETERGHKKRGAIYRQNQKRMDSRINSHFTRYMRKRGHNGTLKPVHKEKLVDIRVKISGQDETVCEMASLSGGERSFTTVSLLLALASVVNSPFHCMDEFDVFTDAMTKHCAIQALLETAATEKTESQFIFFSPQEVGTVEDVRCQINEKHMHVHGEALIPKDFVMIFEMAPPQREEPAASGISIHEDEL